MSAFRRHIVFVTGTRAELGLMRKTLAAIEAHPRLRLSVVATGMHLDPRSGPKLAALTAAGIKPAVVVPWPRKETPAGTAEVTGLVTAKLARAFAELKADCVLVVGDRVEAFAAAVASHLSRIPLAHVHGGDRAEGQVDDSLRHAITKLAHVHFAASVDAATRIERLGEDPISIHRVGAPGVESIREEAARGNDVRARFPHIRHSAVVLLHPTSPDAALEESRASALIAGLLAAGYSHHLLLLPNNDPGNEGIHRAWAAHAKARRRPSDVRDARSSVTAEQLTDLPRPLFLGLLRDCRLLAGNSSAGIIEAASFGTPVLDVGPRQSGRLHGANVLHCSYGRRPIEKALTELLAWPRRGKSNNPYEGRNTAARIARTLATAKLAYPAPPKLICY